VMVRWRVTEVFKAASIRSQQAIKTDKSLPRRHLEAFGDS
jgi:hypothetical protein